MLRVSAWSFVALTGIGAVAHAEVVRSPAESDIRIQVIYGADDRKDLYQVTDANLLRLADSTVAMIASEKLTAKGEVAHLDAGTFGESNNLCTDEPFYQQPDAADCSGSLVGPDLVLTAGHCVQSENDCLKNSFVFGYAVYVDGATAVNTLRAQDIYQCAKIVVQRWEPGREGLDYAVVQLDRPVPDHAPLRLRRSGVLETGSDLVVIGHPYGLPVKIAGGAQVRAVKPGYFTANLDTYRGNSGSAVFNAHTGLIEGVLVRGSRDLRFREIGKTGEFCNESNRCADDECQGEDATLVEAVLPFIPEF